ncbi:RtcB family protein [Cytophagaceae bacterium YF14B1]|uniref:tRNA-splicing ligase RtcB n=1 Tax=Xanthocytophaga flava TaxID=3048013 RepID=A0AAE3U9X4_9BACT|nr:RtcB family protein [Xanthocytophaga flavus]MDJ1482179.1 RtcB family protein [Xanthocytophaga flavus]
MKRISSFESVIGNAHGIPVHLFANEQVKVENSAIEELLGFLELQHTLEQIQHTDPDFFGTSDIGIGRVAITPDFHKGSGIPIGTTITTKGFILPQAIGKDINCGMRLYVTDLSEDQVRSKLKEMTKRIRHVYFQGGRELPITPHQKKALLQHGLQGLWETSHETAGKGLWRQYNALQQETDLQRVIDRGSLQAGGIFNGLENYTSIDYTSYDAQLGSIGGGNHFVEVQRVADITEGAIAYEWGLKKDAVVVMIHTGSVSIGYPTAMAFKDYLTDLYPTGLRKPDNGILPLPISEKYAGFVENFFMGLYNAANFAFANRLFLGLMMQKVFSEFFGEMDFRLLYDSGHNMVWQQKTAGEEWFLHRKGACPARGAEQLQNTPFAWTGEPALIPGSMGTSSFILAGCGNEQSNFSASHGAGRSLSRGESMKYDEAAFAKFLEEFHIITPIDPESTEIKSRRDIIQKWHDELKKEAPFAFKPVRPVIDTQLEAGIVRQVAETRPIFTVKG